MKSTSYLILIIAALTALFAFTSCESHGGGTVNERLAAGAKNSLAFMVKDGALDATNAGYVNAAIKLAETGKVDADTLNLALAALSGVDQKKYGAGIAFITGFIAPPAATAAQSEFPLLQ